MAKQLKGLTFVIAEEIMNYFFAVMPDPACQTRHVNLTQ